NPVAQQQMQNMLERLNMLRDRHLGPAEQGLTTAGKSLEQIAEPPPGSATSKEARDVAPKQAGNDQSPDAKDQTPSQPAGKEGKDQSPSQQPGGKQGESKADQKGASSGDRKDQAG